MADDKLSALIDQMEQAGETPESIAEVVKTWNPNALSIDDKRTSRDANIAAQAGAVDDQSSVGGAMLRGGLEGAKRGAMEFGKRILRSPYTAAEGFVGLANTIGNAIDVGHENPGAPTFSDMGKGLAEDAKTAAGTANVFMHPAQTLLDPMSPAEQPSETLRKTSGEPELLARKAGDIGGAMILGKAAPVLPEQGTTVTKTMARGVGRTTKSMAKAAGWPATMKGVHELAMGNPIAGAVFITAPKAIMDAGEALLRWGTDKGAALATPSGQLLKLRSELAMAGPNPPVDLLTRTRAALSEMQSNLDQRISVAKLDSDIAPLRKELDQLGQITGQLDKKIAGAAKSTKPIDPAKQWAETARSENARAKFIEKDQAQTAKNLNTTDKYRRTVEQARDAADAETGRRSASAAKSTEQGWQQEAKNLNARQAFQDEVSTARGMADAENSAIEEALARRTAKGFEQDARNLNARDKFVRADEAQTAKNLNARDKYIADDQAQTARNLNKRDSYLEDEYAQDARNLNTREDYIDADNVQAGRNADTRRAYERKVEVDRDLADREAAAREAGAEEVPTESTTPEQQGPFSNIDIANLRKQGFTDEAIAKMESLNPTVGPVNKAPVLGEPVDVAATKAAAPTADPIEAAITKRESAIRDTTSKNKSPIRGYSTNDIPVLAKALNMTERDVLHGLADGSLEVPPNVSRLVKSESAARAKMHRTNAGLDAGARRTAEREKL